MNVNNACDFATTELNGITYLPILKTYTIKDNELKRRFEFRVIRDLGVIEQGDVSIERDYSGQVLVTTRYLVPEAAIREVACVWSEEASLPDREPSAPERADEGLRTFSILGFSISITMLLIAGFGNSFGLPNTTVYAIAILAALILIATASLTAAPMLSRLREARETKK